MRRLPLVNSVTMLCMSIYLCIAANVSPVNQFAPVKFSLCPSYPIHGPIQEMSSCSIQSLLIEKANALSFMYDSFVQSQPAWIDFLIKAFDYSIQSLFIFWLFIQFHQLRETDTLSFHFLQKVLFSEKCFSIFIDTNHNGARWWDLDHSWSKT